MGIPSITETEEQKQARLAREEQEKRNAAQLSLADAKGFLGTIGDLVGTVFNWGIPALIFGGILLAAAKPISELIRQFSPEWADKFLDYTEFAKDWINEKTGKEIFTVDEARIENAKRNAVIENPELIRAPIAQNFSPEIAEAIIPDKAAAEELINTFLPSQKLSLQQLQDNPALFMQPAVLNNFVRSHPQTMQRVVAALPQGGAGQIPATLKAPLKELLGNSQSLQALLANPQHAHWINSAVTKFGGAQGAALFTSLAQQPEQLAPLLAQVIDGASPQQLLVSMQAQGPLPAQVQQAIGNAAYEAIKQDAALGPVLAILEARDASFADALKSLDPNNLQANALKLITAKPERIAALKDLSTEQLAALFDKFGLPLEGNTAVLLGHKPTRDAAVDMLTKLVATNSEGKNELGEMLASAMGAQNPLARIGVLAGYLQGNPERLGALHDFKLAAERIGAGRGDDAKPAYAAITGTIGSLVGNAPQAAQLASAAEQLPDSLKPVIDGVLTNGPSYLSQLMFNDTNRAFLNLETDGRKNLYRVGDALASMDASKFAGGAAALTMLTTKRGDTYPNLDAIMQAAATMDNHTGSTIAVAEGLAMKPENERSEDEKALLDTEKAADANNQNILGVLVAAAQGKLTRVGEENGADTRYNAETFVGPVQLSGKELAAFFNNGEQQSITAITGLLNTMDTSKMDKDTQAVIASLREHFWVDGNKNGQVEPGEGAANFLYDPVMVDRLLATAATGESQFSNIAMAGASAALNVASFGFFGQTKEWSDGLRMATIAQALGNAGVGKTDEAQSIAAPDPLRIALAGGIPMGASPLSK